MSYVTRQVLWKKIRIKNTNITYNYSATTYNIPRYIIILYTLRPRHVQLVSTDFHIELDNELPLSVEAMAIDTINSLLVVL